MAVSDIAAYANLTNEDIEAIGSELDLIRQDIEESLGARDAAYIYRVIRFQRTLDIASRLVIAASRSRVGWLVGTVSLAYAKSVENMEIGHNVGHGQWDWMNDPEVHSTTWEWDMAGSSRQWRYSHNYRHHVFSNVLGVDDDLGFGVLRVTRDQPWKREHLFQPLRNLLLAVVFEWGIARHGLHAERDRALSEVDRQAVTRTMLTKAGRQITKDYLVWPGLSLHRWRRTLAANITANLLRNLWAYVVIFCGHFPDGVQQFTPESLDDESRGQWYLRQMLGAADFTAGPLLAFSSGNLCYQIEHHLFPDLPSNRYEQISHRVRALCEKYDLDYVTGSLPRQYLQTVRTTLRLALPDGGFRAVFRPSGSDDVRADTR
ncbi:acyl-CoA desaturase [Mycolicibacterium neoaurum]|uniref:fatty acid desaturase family protein n=1 Tax=Mycolicibacterium neoaurum TaxID=1795 RepID=UPI00248C71A2|nr:acyl-CoA desaturase [Mycolicibacterium neoaurum]WBP97332.1 acyl-CoA desaturase [Mycolicibacterium neoaurum]WBS11054.1 acyl-CoA desaturase [Mycolicibacterium neoaurum]